MVKIIYEDCSHLPEKTIREVITHHLTIKEAEDNFIKRNWGKPYRIVSLQFINQF